MTTTATAANINVLSTSDTVAAATRIFDKRSGKSMAPSATMSASSKHPPFEAPAPQKFELISTDGVPLDVLWSSACQREREQERPVGSEQDTLTLRISATVLTVMATLSGIGIGSIIHVALGL